MTRSRLVPVRAVVLVAATLFLALFLGRAGGAYAEGAQAETSADAETLLVTTEPGVSAGELAAEGAFVLRRLPEYGVFQVRVDGGEARDAEEALQRVPGVLDVRVEGELEAFQIVDDPLYAMQWWLGALAAPEVWGNPALSAAPVVAILDTGLDTQSPEFAGRVVSPRSFAEGDAPSDVTDQDGHGTYVASIIAAEAGNGFGGAGVSPGARIMPLKLSHTRTFKESSAVAAIDYAVDHGADVINMSWGSRDAYPLIAQALTQARERGTLLVAAAGNGGGEPVYFPASEPSTIAVGAVDEAGELTSFSATGPQIELVAPGRHLLINRGDGPTTYELLNGTSFSAPMVSGTASLVLSANPRLSGDEARAFLAASAEDRGAPGRDYGYGFGVVDAAAAVGMTLEDLATPDRFPDAGVGYAYRLAVEALSDDGIVEGYSDGTFRPHNDLFRAQFAKMVVLALGNHTVAMDDPADARFVDVPYDGRVYPYDYVEEAASAGVIRGYSDGTFRPYESILRGQLIAMVARAAHLPEPPAGYETDFGNFSPALYADVRRAAYAGLLDGLQGIDWNYDFWQPADRGEAAALLYALLARG